MTKTNYRKSDRNSILTKTIGIKVTKSEYLMLRRKFKKSKMTQSSGLRKIIIPLIENNDFEELLKGHNKNISNHKTT